MKTIINKFSKIYKKKNSEIFSYDFIEKSIYLDEETKIVSVDKEWRKRPEFLSWYDKNIIRKDGYGKYKIRSCPISTIQAMQRAGHIIITQDLGNDGAEDSALKIGIELMQLAAECSATDVRIVVRINHTEIFFRIKKEEMLLRELSKELGQRIITALYRYGEAGDSTYSAHKAQDGGIPGEKVHNDLSNIRLSRTPIYPEGQDAQTMSLRLQYKGGRPPIREKFPDGANFISPKIREIDAYEILERSGYDPAQITTLLSLIYSGSGAFILSGPTGSGKSTLQQILMEIYFNKFPGQRQISIEQPVEEEKPWAIQMSISDALDEESVGEEVRAKVRQSLRMDPDFLSIQEIRDAEITRAAIHAVQTGHGLMTTLHISDPFEFASRIHNLDPKNLPYSIVCDPSLFRAVIYQRLLATLCPECKIPWSSDSKSLLPVHLEALSSWGDMSTVFQKNPTGCPKCGWSGKQGLTCVAEVVVSDRELMDDIIKHGTHIARRKYRSRKNADRSIIQRAFELAHAGKIDPISILTLDQGMPTKEEYFAEIEVGRKERLQEGRLG